MQWNWSAIANTYRHLSPTPCLIIKLHIAFNHLFFLSRLVFYFFQFRFHCVLSMLMSCIGYLVLDTTTTTTTSSTGHRQQVTVHYWCSAIHGSNRFHSMLFDLKNRKFDSISSYKALILQRRTSYKLWWYSVRSCRLIIDANCLHCPQNGGHTRHKYRTESNRKIDSRALIELNLIEVFSESDSTLETLCIIKSWLNYNTD